MADTPPFPIVGRRILLVEDDATAAYAIARMLAWTRRWTLEVAATADAALARLDQGGIDAVLLDLNLPDSRGTATVATVAGRFPEVPIVVITSSYGGEDEALRQGADDYISKSDLETRSLERSLTFAIARSLSEPSARSRSNSRRAEDVIDRLTAALEATSEALFILGAEGRCWGANGAFARLLGVDRLAVLDGAIDDRVALDRLDAWQEARRSALEAGTAAVVVGFTGPDPRTRTVRLTRHEDRTGAPFLVGTVDGEAPAA